MSDFSLFRLINKYYFLGYKDEINFFIFLISFILSLTLYIMPKINHYTASVYDDNDVINYDIYKYNNRGLLVTTTLCCDSDRSYTRFFQVEEIQDNQFIIIKTKSNESSVSNTDDFLTEINNLDFFEDFSRVIFSNYNNNTLVISKDNSNLFLIESND